MYLYVLLQQYTASIILLFANSANGDSSVNVSIQKSMLNRSSPSIFRQQRRVDYIEILSHSLNHSIWDHISKGTHHSYYSLIFISFIFYLLFQLLKVFFTVLTGNTTPALYTSLLTKFTQNTQVIAILGLISNTSQTQFINIFILYLFILYIFILYLFAFYFLLQCFSHTHTDCVTS